jgi:hypothetical protein
MSARTVLVPLFLLLTVALGAGCKEEASGGSCPDGTAAISLDGEFPCGNTVCASGQLCSPAPRSDASVGHECVDVPSGCTVCECTRNNCPPCLAALCWSDPYLPDVYVTGRTLGCPNTF